MEITSKSFIVHTRLMTPVKILITYFTWLTLDLLQVLHGYLHLPLLIWKQRLRRILAEATLDHLLDLESLDSQQVQDHIVRQTELRPQFGRIAKDHLP